MNPLCRDCCPDSCPVLAAALACPSWPSAIRPHGHARFRDLMRQDPGTWGPHLVKLAHQDAGRPPPPLPPPPPVWPRPDGRLRVGFAGSTYMAHGGTETWHQTLLPALVRSGKVQVIGAAFAYGDGDPSLLGGVPVGWGVEAVRSLARSVDAFICWGFHELGTLIPPKGDPARPEQVVMVLHATSQMPWAMQILREGAPHADRLVGVSSCALADLPETVDSLPRTVIPNAIDPARAVAGRTREAVRAEWSVSPEMIVCLGTHRLSIEKRLPVLAEAMAGLAPPFQLVLAGDGPERPSVTGKPGVTLLGRREDIGDLLAGADLFVAASEYEGFGLSTAEAMAAGVPVISTPVGFLVDHPDLARTVPIDAGPTEWAEAIRADWRDAIGRAARAEEAQAFVRQHFSPDGFVRAWEDYLLSLPRPVPLSQIAKPAPANVPAPSPRRSPRAIREFVQVGQGIAAKVRDCPEAGPAPATWGQTCGCTRVCRKQGQGVTYSACVTCLTPPAITSVRATLSTPSTRSA